MKRTILLLSFLSIVGALPASAQYSGTALWLDSARSYAAVPVRPPLINDTTDPFTLEAWVYADSDDFTIVGGYDENGERMTWQLSISEYLWYSSDTSVHRVLVLQDFGQTDESRTRLYQSSSGLVPDRWNHVAVTSNSSTLRFYINGVEAGSYATNATIWRPATTFYVGARINDYDGSVLASNAPHGRIDNLYFWGLARNAGEIRAGLLGNFSQGAGAFGLIEHFGFDSLTAPTSRATITLHNGAELGTSTAPFFSLPLGYGYGASEVGLLWSDRFGMSSSILTVGIDQAIDGEYLAFGHDTSPLQMESSTIPGISRQLGRSWAVMPVGLSFATFSFDLSGIDGLTRQNGVILASPAPDFSTDVEYLFSADSASEAWLKAGRIVTDDTTWITIGQLSVPRPRLVASLGFGPFTQTDDNRNTFTIDSLPSGTSRVAFSLYDPYRQAVIDSVSQSGLTPSYSYQMGDLPVGAVLRVDITATSFGGTLRFVEPIAISEQKPSITSTNGFDAYALYTPKQVTYEVDSLPANTTAVTMRMVDGAGRTVRFIDTNDVVIMDSIRITSAQSGGNPVTGASWTVQLDTLDLPLDAQLSVTVEHDGGVPGGTEYLIPLHILPPRMSLFSTLGFGPFESNNYSRVVNSTTPWSDVTDVRTTVAVDPIPPRTRNVIFRVMREDSTFIPLDTVASNGVQWLSSAISDEIVVTDLPPDALYVQALIDAEGAPGEGLIVQQDIDIVPQLPRVFLTPSDYDNVVRNPFDPDDRKVSEVEVRVEPSTAQTDSIVAEIVDLSGGVIDRVKLSPAVGTTPGFSFTYDFASLYFTADSIIFYTYSPVREDSIRSAADITLIPPRPIVEALNGLDIYHPGSSFWEFFRISGFMPEVTRVDALVDAGGDRIVEILDILPEAEGDWSPGSPFNRSLRFDGSSTWFSTEPIDSQFTVTLWFRSTDSSAPILGQQNISDTDNRYAPLLYLDEAGRLVYSVTDFASNTTRRLTSVGSFNDGEWHHVGLTYERGRTLMELYVDFGPRSETRQAPASRATSALTVGRGGFSVTDTLPGGYFAGDMAMLTVWNRRKTYDSLVGSIYPTGLLNWDVDGNNGDFRSDNRDGLTHYIAMDGAGGGTITDEAQQSEYELHGSVQVNNVRSMASAIVGWGLKPTGYARTPDAQLDSASLTLRLYYPGSPSDGEPYRTWMKLDWDTLMYVESNRGFGPFRQGVAMPVTYSIRTFGGLNPSKIVAILRDSSGAQITTSTDDNGPDGWHPLLDMGDAKPGSTVIFRAENSSGGVLHTTSPYELIVEPFVPPTVAGHTGPFDRAIVDGTMRDSNTFTITSYESDIRFDGIFYGATWNRIDSVKAVQTDDTTWTVTSDMAALEPPTSYVVVKTYVGLDTTPDAYDTLAIEIAETRPMWFGQGSDFTNVTTGSDGKISFQVSTEVGNPVHYLPKFRVGDSTLQLGIDMRHLYDQKVPGNVPLLGGLGLQAPWSTIIADVTYDPASHRLTLDSKPKVNGNTFFFGTELPFSDESSTSGSIDTDNELQLVHDYTVQETHGIPGLSSTLGSSGSSIFTLIKALIKGEEAFSKLDVVSPYVTLKPIMSLGFASRLNAGSTDSGWGAIGELKIDGGTASTDGSYQISQFGLGIELSLGIQAFYGAAACEFDMSLEGILSAGASYVSLPKPRKRELFSGGINFYGEVVAKFLWGLDKKSLWGPEMFYHHSWGDDIPELWPKPEFSPFGRSHDEKGGPLSPASVQEGTSHAQVAPLIFPQPGTSTAQNRLGVVWLEQDPSTGIGTLKLDAVSGIDGESPRPIIVASNDNAIAVPQVDNLDDSTHLVVWSQSRYSRGTTPYDADPLELARSIDIWYAVVNSSSGVVEQTGILDDNFAGLSSGRLEGNPDVAAIGEDRGLVSWIVADPGSESSELYYATLTRNTNGAWSASAPTFATQLAGVETGLRVIGTGRGDASIVWINRSGTDSDDPSVMAIGWDGEAFGSPTTLLPQISGVTYNEVDGIIEGDNGLLAVTGIDERGGTPINVVTMIPRSGNAWNVGSAFTHEDSSGVMQRPNVGINEEGIASVLFQLNNTAATNDSRISHLDLVVVDLEDASSMEHYPAHELLSDTGTLLRGGAAAMLGDRLIIFSHEIKNPFGTHDPLNGRQFGDVPTNLVVRAVRITDDLEVVDIDEEDLFSSVPDDRPVAGVSTGAVIDRITPMPIGAETTVEYRLARPSDVVIELIDSRGEVVATIARGHRAAGSHTAAFDGTSIPAGAYLVRLRMEGWESVRGVVRVGG